MKIKARNKKSWRAAGLGVAVGLINGMLGAGGGMLAVPLLKSLGLGQKAAHANAVAVILPIAALSGVLYSLRGYVSPGDALVYMPAGLIGSVAGTLVIRKISPLWLKRIFGCFMVYAGARLLFR